MFGLITYAILDISYNTIIWSSIKTIRCGGLLYYYLYDNYSNYKNNNALEYKDVESEQESSNVCNKIHTLDENGTRNNNNNNNNLPPSYKNTIESISIEEIKLIHQHLQEHSRLLNELNHTLHKKKYWLF
jgi:hypothetical protein